MGQGSVDVDVMSEHSFVFGKISKGQFVVLDTVVVLRLMAKPAVDGQHEEKTILGP